MDLRHASAIRERLAVIRYAAFKSFDRCRISEDRDEFVSAMTDGD